MQTLKYLLAAMALVITLGCHEESKNLKAAAEPKPRAEGETVFRFHWVGKTTLLADTNSASISSIWQLPETLKLEGQVMEKLAAWLSEGSSNSESPSNSLNPSATMVKDLLNAETYLEARTFQTNGPLHLAFAVRMNPVEPGSWVTNVVFLNRLLTNAPSLHLQGLDWLRNPPVGFVHLATAGEWTGIGLSPGSNEHLEEFLKGVSKSTQGGLATGTNLWAEGDVNPARLDPPDAPHKIEPLPRLSFTLGPGGHGASFKALLTFPQPLNLSLDEWRIPTNLVHDPLMAFFAARGVSTLISKVSGLSAFSGNPPPNQVFTWSQTLPFQTYFAYPCDDPTNAVAIAETFAQKNINPWLRAHSSGLVERSTNYNGIVWTGAPLIIPAMRLAPAEAPGFVWGGFVPRDLPRKHMPPELINEVLSRTNLICYDWELTGARVDGWLQLGQLLRLILERDQLPAESAGANFLKAITPKLGNCVTVLSLEGTNQIAVTRTATVGFSSLELHALADWFESPRFPKGLHSELPAPVKATAPPH